MSRVILLSAERPMPLYEPELRRMSVSGGFTAETPGFSVQTHEYYRDAVDDLGLEMKPFSYELNLEATVEDAEQLRTYLEVNCHSGEAIELWNLWVGDGRDPKIPHYRGRLSDLAMDTLYQLCCPPMQNGEPGQCRITVTI